MTMTMPVMRWQLKLVLTCKNSLIANCSALRHWINALAHQYLVMKIVSYIDVKRKTRRLSYVTVFCGHGITSDQFNAEIK